MAASGTADGEALDSAGGQSSYVPILQSHLRSRPREPTQRTTARGSLANGKHGPSPTLAGRREAPSTLPRLLHSRIPHALSSNLDALGCEIALLRRLVELRWRSVETPQTDLSGDWLQFQKESRRFARAEQKAVAAGVALPLPALVARFELSRVERWIVLALLGPHLDASLLPYYRALRGGGWWDGVDLRLLLTLLADNLPQQLAVRRALTPHGTLMARRLVLQRPARGGQSTLNGEVDLPGRLVHLLIGDEAMGGAVHALCERLPPGPTVESVVLPELLKRHACMLIAQGDGARRTLAGFGVDDLVTEGHGVVLLLTGASGTGKTLFARALGRSFDRPVLRAKNDLLLRADQPQAAVDGLHLETELAGGLLLVEDCDDLLEPSSPLSHALLGLLDRLRAPVVLTTRRPALLDAALDRRVLYRMDLPMPQAQERELLWELHLPAAAPLADDIDLGELAARYPFSGGAIRQAALAALHLALQHNGREPRLDRATLLAAADSQVRTALDEYTLSEPCRRTLADIVLPGDVRQQVLDLLGACRHRTRLMTQWGFAQRLSTGLGIVALFDGPPGTGKTFCAEVLGAELAMTVARIHVPAIVSKWVGETEQRLADVFRRARSSGAILLFDEADSLFGRRVAEASSANDRYANMEVNLLLQEIERYDGIVILTTNLAGALDPALLRRIHYRITFPEQDAELRGRIFQSLVPDQVPLARDVDFAELGRRYELAGGRIQNAVLRAAYAALSAGAQQLGMAHLLRACDEEAKAAGKLVWSGSGRPGGPNLIAHKEGA